jgi:hypothetical protein
MNIYNQENKHAQDKLVQASRKVIGPDWSLLGNAGERRTMERVAIENISIHIIKAWLDIPRTGCIRELYMNINPF